MLNANKFNRTRELARLRKSRCRQSFQEVVNTSASDESTETSQVTVDLEEPATEPNNELNNIFLNDEFEIGESSSDESEAGEDENISDGDLSDESVESEYRFLESDEDEELIGNNPEDVYDDIEELRQWALADPPIPHTRLESLLKILRREKYPMLPKCAKTFLGTEKYQYDIEKLDDNDSGEFLYFGIEKNLQRCVNSELHEVRHLQLLINVDGVPLYKSSSMQLWPILCKVFNQPDIYKPFLVAVYCGKQKPSNVNNYLRKFVTEVNHLQDVGIRINDVFFEISIKAFICDRPARAFIKSIKGHGGYWACERCEVKGQRVDRRTTYPIRHNQCIPRTNNSFRNQRNAEHHTGVSPLLEIEPAVDMINDFVLDSMHMVYLGIVKKVFDYWLNGNIKEVKLSKTMKDLLCDLLLQLKNQVPQDFQRTTRSLDDFAKFKATEYQFMLLYAGPVVLKKILSPDVYKHFLLLHVGIRILASKDLAVEKRRQAKYCLKLFVETSIILYGKQCLISNMHGLIHLPDDVEKMNCSIPEISAYTFENELGKLGRLIRTGNKPLSQLCRRMNELMHKNIEMATIPPNIKILKQSHQDEFDNTPITRIQFKGTIITTKHPNNTVLLQDKKIIQVSYIFIPPGENNIYIKSIKLKKVCPIYEYPFNSEYLNMWVVNERNCPTVTVPLNNVDKKMVCFVIRTNNKKKMYAMPLLHM